MFRVRQVKRDEILTLKWWKESLHSQIQSQTHFFSPPSKLIKKDLLILEIYLKKPLQPSHVIALKWKPVALSPHTPQIRGAFRSNSWGPTTDVVTVMGSITVQARENREKERGKKKIRVQFLQTNTLQTDTDTLPEDPG